ncbi:MAG: RnfABCDGE type electron transport complex subunit G [Epulopiscium sp.]|nr:RnfABCDGE type electron transport complex subunit G [Candidatus Epulonipiscium sp.]
MNETLKMGLILCLITVLSGFSLGMVYEVTKEPIAQQKIKTHQEAMKAVLPEVETFELIESDDFSAQYGIKEIQIGYKGTQIIGYVMQVITKGYGGEIEMMVGINQEGIIQGVKIVQHAETAGLGANAKEPSFLNQYVNKSAEQSLWVTKSTPTNDQEVEAITGATITTEAVTSGINNALTLFKEKLK